MRYVYDTAGVGGALDRVSAIADLSGTTHYAEYDYLGAGTIVSVSHPQVSGGLNLSYDSAGDYSFSGWDRFGRTLEQYWKRDDGTLIDGYEYTYDRAGNRLSRTNLRNNALNETYSYDGLNRLTDTDRNGADAQSWNLDALGNWSGFTDGTTTQTRTVDAANQITGISGGWVSPEYDAAGNLIVTPMAGNETVALHLTYDAWNRLTAVRTDDNGQPGAVIAAFKYDGLGRRIQKIAGGVTFDYYYNESWQILQVDKQTGQGNSIPYAQYVYDIRYIDAPVLRLRDSDGNATLDEVLYYLQDGNYNTTALVSPNGTVAERSAFTSFGKPTIYSADWTELTTSTVDNNVLYGGYQWDKETALFYARHRYYHFSMGTWTARDFIDYGGGMNLQAYCEGDPVGATDTLGLQSSGGIGIPTSSRYVPSSAPERLPSVGGAPSIFEADARIDRRIEEVMKDPKMREMYLRAKQRFDEQCGSYASADVASYAPAAAPDGGPAVQAASVIAPVSESHQRWLDSWQGKRYIELTDQIVWGNGLDPGRQHEMQALEGIASGGSATSAYAGYLQYAAGEGLMAWSIAAARASGGYRIGMPPGSNRWRPSGCGAAREGTAVDPQVSNAVNAIEKYLGKGYTIEKSPTSDLYLRSANGIKSVRFDLTDPHGLDPHINIETWQPRNLFPGDKRLIRTTDEHVFVKP